MFGTLRMALALLVVMGHTPKNNLHFQISITAVIIFYMITGYLMSFKFRSYAKETRYPLLVFAVDRFFRIYPLYFFVVVATLVLTNNFGLSDSLHFSRELKNVVLNLLLIPVNYTFATSEVTAVIPQAHSLALEEQFYLLLPFLLLYRKIGTFFIFLGTFSLLLVALTPFSGESQILPSAVLTYLDGLFHNVGVERYTNDLLYRFLPSVLPIFLIGVYLNRNTHSCSIFFTRLIYCSYSVIFLGYYVMGYISRPLIFHISIGVLVGYPLIVGLSKLKRNKFDEFLGNASYGIFLVHWTVLWGIERYELKDDTHVRGLMLVLSVALGYLLYYGVERPGQKVRKRTTEWLVKRFPL